MKRPSVLVTPFAFAVLGLSLCLYAGAVRADRNAFPRLMRQGHEAMARKDWRAAASAFRGAVSYDPGSADARAALGMAYLHLSETGRARDEFAAALRHNRHCADAERGIHLLRTPEEEEKAFKELEAQARREVENASLLASYAEELIERSRYEEAAQAARAALKIKPKLGHAYCALGRVATHNGDDAEAEKDFALAIRADNRDDDAFGGLGDLLMKRKDYKKAIENYERAARIVPEERVWHEKLRDVYTAAGDILSADREAKIIEALTKMPDGK